MKLSYLTAGAVAVAAVAWVLSGQFGPPPEPAEAAGERLAAAAEPALPQVRVRRQTAEPRAAEIVLRGRTAAVRAVELRAETRGSVAELLAEKGAAVAAGDVIARLKQDDRLARLREAKALLEQRRIEFDAATKLSAKGYRAETSVAEARAKLEQANAAVAAMEIDIGYTTIRAPFDGVVDARSAEIGDFLDVGDPIATIIDLDPILIVGQISERDVGQAKVGATGAGQLVTGERVAGVLRYVSVVADEATRTFRVELEVANPERRIPHGVSSELRLPLAESLAHRVSPAILTLADDGTIGVKIVTADDVVRFHPVTIVGDGPDGVWLAGLPETVTFVTVGQEFVGDGRRVRPVPEGPAS
ncbi:MAG TPA: efflux RND transporter periplasmic adaptor subunit [Dongiaceae bacterium]|nr:efflux RND transporter periplasmic adaptor subunit [Dongiaceae bacterium]